MKILIIRFSSIGDILLTTPFIRQVRSQFPQAQIDYVIKSKFSELIRYNPHLNNIYEFGDPPAEPLNLLVKRINPEKYSIIFDLHNNIRSNIVRHRIHAKKKYHIRKNKFEQKLLIWFKKNLYGKITPIPERYLAVGEACGIQDDNKGLEFFWPKQTEQKLRESLSQTGLDLEKPIIGLVPGAGFFTKRWPLESFTELAKHISKSYQIVVLGGKNETGLGEVLASNQKILNLAGKLSLLETGIAISLMNLVISNDSGLMHMATAVNTPVVAIFGSSVKELGFFPYRGKSIVLENMELNCRPCSHIGREDCPQDHFKCMREISPEKVYDSAMEILGE